jgi:hypothetical protein
VILIRQEVTEITAYLSPEGKALCRKCCSDRIKVVYFEKEGKKFAVCEACGNVQSIGASLQDRYSKWKQYRELPR